MVGKEKKKKRTWKTIIRGVEGEERNINNKAPIKERHVRKSAISPGVITPLLLDSVWEKVRGGGELIALNYGDCWTAYGLIYLYYI